MNRVQIINLCFGQVSVAALDIKRHTTAKAESFNKSSLVYQFKSNKFD
ncbi:hypothetical protein CCP3SC5AM1_350023 [Gammaproteobacteria bacterium]